MVKKRYVIYTTCSERNGGMCWSVDLASIAILPAEAGDGLEEQDFSLHSAIYVYRRCLTINSVCILTLIVGNRLHFPEYTYS